MKKRTKAVLVVLAFVLGLSYFAFTLAFYDPFEGDFLAEDPGAVAIEYAVPRTVDFFVHKRGLEDDFEPGEFPVPRFWSRLRFDKAWQEFERTLLHARLERELDVGAKVEALRQAAADVPFLTLEDDLIGRECAVFGRVAGQGYERSEVAMIALGSGWARFAYEAAGSALVSSFVTLPFEVAVEEDGTRTFTLQDGRTIHAWRHLDLFVLSTGPLLVREVKDLVELEEVGRDKSLGAMRRYSSTVAQDVADFAGLRTLRAPAVDLSNRVQLAGRLGPLFSLPQVTVDDDFAEPRGEMSRWIAAKLFHPRYFEDLTLDVTLAPTLEVRGMLGFFREKAEGAESGFYDRRTFELQEVMDNVAKRLPRETFFVMAARVDMRRFLPMLVKGLTEIDPDARKTLDDVMGRFRSVRKDFRPANALEAAQQVAGFLGDDVVLALRRDTYFGEPRHPMPIVTLFFQVTERGPTFEQLNAAAGDPAISGGYNGFVFPIMKAHTALGSLAKWFNVTFAGGVQVQDVLIADPGGTVKNVAFGILDPPTQTKGPWTLAVSFSPRLETFPVEGKPEGEARGTAGEMLTDLVHLTRSEGATSVALDPRGGQREIHSLLHAPRYRESHDFLKGFASIAVFLDAERWKESLRDRAGDAAFAEAREDRSWWEQKRKEFAAELMAGEFAEWKGKPMPQDVEERFEARIKAREEQLDDARLETAKRDYQEGLAWVDLLEHAFVAARIDEASQNIELRAQVKTRVR